MYTSFEVSRFRGIKHLQLRDLGQINLLTGLNNVGKTTLLESLFVHAGGYNAALVMKLNVFRGIESVKVEWAVSSRSPWRQLFHEFNEDLPIELKGREAGSRCVIVDVVDRNYVIVTGPPEVTGVRRRRVNMSHLQPLDEVVEISRNASDENIAKLLG